MAFRIVETDNFGRDYPDEKFVNIPTINNKGRAQAIANAINMALPANHPRFYRVVNEDYKLSPGFEP